MRFSDPEPRLFFVNKRHQDGATHHRVTADRLMSGGAAGWRQVTGENKRDWEMSYFHAYESEFPERHVSGFGIFAE